MRNGWSTPHPAAENRLDTHFTADSVSRKSGLDRCGKSLPPPSTEIRSPDRQSHNYSLYRMSYPGPLHFLDFMQSFWTHIQYLWCDSQNVFIRTFNAPSWTRVAWRSFRECLSQELSSSEISKWKERRACNPLKEFSALSFSLPLSIFSLLLLLLLKVDVLLW